MIAGGTVVLLAMGGAAQGRETPQDPGESPQLVIEPSSGGRGTDVSVELRGCTEGAVGFADEALAGDGESPDESPPVDVELRAQGDVFVGEHAISAAVEEELGTLAAKVYRVAGATRYQTAARLYPSGGLPPAARWLATGASYPDALAAGAAVPVSGGLAGGGLLLVDGEDIRAIPEVVEALRRDRLALERVYVLGGPDAISEDAVAQLGEVLLTDDLDAPPCDADRLDASSSTVAPDGAVAVTLRHSGPQECTLGGIPEVTFIDEQGRALPTRQTFLAQPQLETSTVVPLVGTTSPPGGADTGGAVFSAQLAVEQGCEEIIEAAALRVELSSTDAVTVMPNEAGATFSACRGEIRVGFLRDSG